MAKGKTAAPKRAVKGRAKAKPPRKKAVAPAKAKTRRAVAPERQTKTELCLALLVRPGGASLAELQEATGWQAHSVRGFLAGTVRKIPGASLTSEKTTDTRRYFLRRA